MIGGLYINHIFKIKIMKVLFTLIFSVFISLCMSSQNILYVDSAATGLNDGTTWTNAYIDLQIALEAAQPGEQIWVGRGTYVPTKDTNNNVAISYNRVFLMRNGVRIYGGFKGNETSLQQRKWRLNKTILSGVPPYTVQSKSNIVVLSKNLDSTASIDGFFITSAYNVWVKQGGSAILVKNGNPVLSNLVLYNNRAFNGGALGLYNSSSLVANVTIKKNYAVQLTSPRGRGGAIYMWGSKPVLINCLITGNTSENRGTAITSIQSQPIIINSTICNNYSNIGNNYDALSISNSSNFVIINSVVEGGIRGFNSFPPPNVAIQNSVVYGSGGSSNWNTNFGTDAGGNLDVSLIHTDSVNGNYRLMECSPGLDTGSTHLLPKDDYDLDYDGITNEFFPYDIEGKPRIVNGKVDIGAYEGPFSYDTTVAELCAGTSIKLEDSTITQTGIYSFRYSRAPGLCDSVLHYNVQAKVNGQIQLDTSNNTLVAMDSNATYQWYDCTNQYALPADTNQSFTPWIPSSYKVIVTKDGCTDTSACITINSVGMEEPLKPLAHIDVFPNPSSGVYKVLLPPFYGSVEYHITDLNGRLLAKGTNFGEREFEIDLTTQPAGIYLLKVSSIEGTITKRLIKQ